MLFGKCGMILFKKMSKFKIKQMKITYSVSYKQTLTKNIDIIGQLEHGEIKINN